MSARTVEIIGGELDGMRLMSDRWEIPAVVSEKPTVLADDDGEFPWVPFRTVTFVVDRYPRADGIHRARMKEEA